MLLIGQFDEVQAMLCQIPLTRFKSKTYQGVLDAKRGISIIEFASDTTIDEELIQIPIPDAVKLIWFEVIRDYGMFDRLEAPTQFS